MNTKETVNLIHALQKLGYSGDDIVTIIEFIGSSDPQTLEKIGNIADDKKKD